MPADTTPAGLARLMQKEQASIASALPPVIGEVFGAPAVAAAAATAATGVASTAKPVVAAIKKAKKVDARPSVAARRASAVTEADAREAQTRGMGPWAILPVGLILGAGLLGIGLLKSSEPAPDRVAVAPAPPAPVAAVPPVAPKAAEPVPAAKAVEAKPATPAPKVAEAKPAGAKPTPTPRAAEPKPAAAAPPPPPGTTTFFGQTPAIAEMPAKPNPDYKPAAVATAIAAIPPAPPPPAPPTAVAAPMPMTPPGVTSYFGPGKPVIEMAAVLNPDYKPAAPPAPSVVEPVVPPAPVVPGVTSFYGVTPSPPDAPAKLNPTTSRPRLLSPRRHQPPSHRRWSAHRVSRVISAPAPRRPKRRHVQTPTISRAKSQLRRPWRLRLHQPHPRRQLPAPVSQPARRPSRRPSNRVRCCSRTRSRR